MSNFYNIPLDDLKNIPSVPIILRKLMKILENSDVPIDEIVQVISLDPLLSAKTLALANSAYYGASKRIVSITQAVTRLGTSEIKKLAISIYFGRMFESLSLNNLTVKRFWTHSIATAFISNRIINYLIDDLSVYTAEKDQFYLLGLLHDIAYLILDAYLPEKVEIIINALERNEKRGLLQTEQELGFFHAREGANLLRFWEIPDSIATPIEYHHTPSECSGDFSMRAGILSVADWISNHLEFSVFGRQEVIQRDNLFWKKFQFSKFSEEELDNFWEDLKSQTLMFLLFSESIIDLRR
ncbi:MAG: HDOD domain-containing protein [Candidatus Cloacimonetes bacterium]|nr:HDOD domain-containing protein [Candidatus Cloacimonadota bacterium]